MPGVTDMGQYAKTTYALIEQKANSNSLIQGLTGIVGFPYTLIADGAVIFTHYGALINEIRAINGYGALTNEMITPLVKSISDEILFDLIGDKVLGQIPIIGIYFNAICAKTMTWRLGILFAMLSLRGEAVNAADAKEIVGKIRQTLPQRDTMRFVQPGYMDYERLIQLA